jgi:hypothetical protein
VVVVNRPEAVRALEFMRDELYGTRVAPLDVLTLARGRGEIRVSEWATRVHAAMAIRVRAMSDTAQSTRCRQVHGFANACGRPRVSAIRQQHLGGAQLAINAIHRIS